MSTAAEKQREAAEKEVDYRLAAKEKLVQEHNERSEGVQPTPTQRECDLMKMGVLLDEKEDDGSEFQEDYNARVLAAGAANPYLTREMEVDTETGEVKPKKKKKRGR